MQPFVIVTLTALSVIAIVAAVLWACSRAGVLRFGRPAAHVDREELSPAESAQPWAGEDPSGPRTLHRCKNGQSTIQKGRLSAPSARYQHPLLMAAVILPLVRLFDRGRL